MCSHYQAIRDRERFERRFGLRLPADTGPYDVWPGYRAPMLRRPQAPRGAPGDAPAQAPSFAATVARFGLLPHWARDDALSRHTYNARSETAHEKPSFRDAWRQAQHCVIPADAIFEPDWSSGRAVPTRIRRADGEPLGIAGLWSRWTARDGTAVDSFAMLTIPAAGHAVMARFHRPQDEKRMVVILPQGAYGAWLDATPDRSAEFMQAYPAQRLVVDATGYSA